MSLDWINTPMLFVINMLAAFRLTRLVVADAIPFGTLRQRLMDHLEARTPWGRKPWPQLTRTETRAHGVYDGLHPLAYLVSCYWCAGLYMAVLTSLLASTGDWWWWAATPLAASAAIGLLANLDD